MQIEIAIAGGRTRVLHSLLTRRLRSLGHAARLAPTGGSDALPSGVTTLMMLEDALFGAPAPDLLAPAAPEASDFEGAAELIIDFGRYDDGEADSPRLFPMFDGQAGMGAALRALLERRSPAITIASRGVDGSTRILARGLAAIENPTRFNGSLNRVLARTVDLMARATISPEADQGRIETREMSAETRPATMASTAFLARSVASKVETRLRSLCAGEDSWRVAWRRVNGDAIHETLRQPAADYTMLRDDGRRYYADPFVFAHEGAIHVFVEDYPFATGRGLISYFTIAPDGTTSAPRPALEAPYHLSYPQVFARDGSIYMLPEAGASNRLTLYRATRFPDQWEVAGVLLDDVAAADATIAQIGSRLWMFANVAEQGQSSWDSLCLFHAARLDGPWTAHPLNPVLIDAAGARPAGELFEHGGVLHRPAQDCTEGYGSGLALFAIDSIGAEGFAQRPVARFRPPPGTGFRGVHTLNAAAGVEVIDLLGSRRREPPPRLNWRSRDPFI